MKNVLDNAIFFMLLLALVLTGTPQFLLLCVILVAVVVSVCIEDNYKGDE